MAKKAKSGTNKKPGKIRDLKPTPAKSRMIKGGRRMFTMT
jgi:hypothetical protein